MSPFLIVPVYRCRSGKFDFLVNFWPSNLDLDRKRAKRGLASLARSQTCIYGEKNRERAKRASAPASKNEKCDSENVMRNRQIARATVLALTSKNAVFPSKMTGFSLF